MDDDFALELESLGLTGHEGRVLSALIRHSPASASWLAKTTGISRSSVYTTLDALVSKGLVGTSYQNEIKQFAAAGHDALLDLLERERDLAAARVATAEALRARFEQVEEDTANLPQLVFFEGQRGLQRVYLQMLREARGPGPMLILRDEFVWREDWAFIHADPWRREVARLKARVGLETRLLVNASEIERGKANDYASRRATQVRYLPNGVRFDRFTCYILDDVVSLLAIDEHALTGVRMANRAFAAGFRSWFEALWAVSSPP